jgi:uncharacterized iron-regulated membrane protein
MKARTEQLRQLLWRRGVVRIVAVFSVIVVLLFIISQLMLGGRVETVFSDINYGLNGGDGAFSGPPMPAQNEEYAAYDEAEEAAALPGAAANQPQTVERMIIKTADLSLQVQDVGIAEAAINEQVALLQGYVVNVQSSGSDQERRIVITFRVPAERFEEALEQVQGLAREVLSIRVSGDDVTEEFVDLNARLRNLEASRDRLLALLNQANEVEDALSVNTALTDIQGQIEQIQGRMQYLQRSSALSTLTVSLSTEQVEPLVDEESWQPLAVASTALRALLGLVQFIINMLIVLLVWVPVWLPLLLLGRWLWRKKKGAEKGADS